LGRHLRKDAVKGVPGKKTDVCDAQWLQQLHAASFPTLAARRLKNLQKQAAALGLQLVSA
jgi:hypothetical protein